MADFTHLTTTEGIENGGVKTARLENHELLVANAGGRYFISDARCPHMGGHLVRGDLEGTVITCPVHHSQFDLEDGRVLTWTDWGGAALTIGKLLRPPRPLHTYEVRVDGSDVFVGPRKAPPATK